MVVREAIPKLFGSIKTTMIELFDAHYATVAKSVAAAIVVAVGH